MRAECALLAFCCIFLIDVTVVTLLYNSVQFYNYIFSRVVILIQIVYIITALYILVYRGMNVAYFIVFSVLPLLLLRFFVKGYSLGLSCLPADAHILPLMRASVAYQMLTDSGRLVYIDPHLAGR